VKRGRVALVAALLFLVGCDPITGSGSGTVPDARKFLTVDSASHNAVLTLIAGYPATNLQFNYNGYANGELLVTVPVGWTLDVQCENRGTVPNSCSVVTDGRATDPVRPEWSTPNPQSGLAPGTSAAFRVVPDAPGLYRITSLVPGREAAGMWGRLQFTPTGAPAISGTSSSG
jgi:hypothetical protein